MRLFHKIGIFLLISGVGVFAASVPANLSYSVNPAIYGVNFAITNNVPTVSGTVSKYSVTPALPAGLRLDSVTGIISGIPTTLALATNYTILAANSAGFTTALVNIAVDTATVPGAPTDVHAIGTGGGNLYVNWLAPASNGGASIISYTVTANPGGYTCTTTTTNCRILSLPDSISTYKITVVATNAVGSGPASVPAGPPLVGIETLSSHQPFVIQIDGSSVSFELPETIGKARLSVIDLQGHEVWIQMVGAGTRQGFWDGKSAGHPVISGVYILRLFQLNADNGTYLMAESKVLITL